MARLLRAQPDGIASIIHGPLKRLAEARKDDDVRTVFHGAEMREKWAAIVRLSTSYAACPRCLEVCPVGWDYLEFLAKEHRNIPEKDDERIRKLKDMTAAEKAGGRAHYATPMDKRWLGEAGYHGLKRGRPGPQ